MKIGFDNEKYLKIQSEHIKERIDQFGDKLLLFSCGRTVIRNEFYPLPGRDVAKVSGGPAGAFDIGTLEDQSCHSSSSQSGS